MACSTCTTIRKMIALSKLINQYKKHALHILSIISVDRFDSISILDITQISLQNKYLVKIQANKLGGYVEANVYCRYSCLHGRYLVEDDDGLLSDEDKRLICIFLQYYHSCNNYGKRIELPVEV